MATKGTPKSSQPAKTAGDDDADYKAGLALARDLERYTAQSTSAGPKSAGPKKAAKKAAVKKPAASKAAAQTPATKKAAKKTTKKPAKAPAKTAVKPAPKAPTPKASAPKASAPKASAPKTSALKSGPQTQAASFSDFIRMPMMTPMIESVRETQEAMASLGKETAAHLSAQAEARMHAMRQLASARSFGEAAQIEQDYLQDCFRMQWDHARRLREVSEQFSRSLSGALSGTLSGSRPF